MCPFEEDKIGEDSSDDSDISMSDTSSNGSSSESETVQEQSDNDENDISMQNEDEHELHDLDIHNHDEEIEDNPVIKAMKEEFDKERNHPPLISCEDSITAISFHPKENLIALSTVVGDICVYKYSNDENTLLGSHEVHTKGCRDVEFDQDGEKMFSCGKDKAIMITDVQSGKLVQFYDDAHPNPINCIRIINKRIFASGDDNGTINLWDFRQNNKKPIFTINKNEDFISDLINDESEKYLLASSGDGSLTSIDLRGRKLFLQSEEYEEELTCLGLFRSETKLIAGSSKGKLFMYNWNEFGLHSDEYPSPNKSQVNDLVPITENIVVTANEDGTLRAAHLFPHRYLGIVGQHTFSVENVDICNDGTFIASSSHDNDVKFWNVSYFENFDEDLTKSKKNKKKELKNNLPSSKVVNAGDFFSGLC